MGDPVPVTMSDEDFEVVYNALKAVTTPYTDEQIPGIILGERRAWDVVRRVKEQRGTTAGAPNNHASAPRSIRAQA